jgi:tetratricopeptide (TPR) repeat protein
MSQSTPPDESDNDAEAGGSSGEANLSIEGGAAILAPVGAFPGGVPQGALVVLPIKKPTDELLELMKQGPVALKPEQMWQLLGFNGPAVQVQDAQGRPVTMGLEDLLGGLDRHWRENGEDLNRGRLYAQELIKYGRHEQAEKVLAKVVAAGGTGLDWLALGVAQASQQKWDKAESTLKGAQNLAPDSPFPSLQLARVFAARNDVALERQMTERAIGIEPGCVEAWAYLFARERERSGEEAAERTVTELANAEPNKRSAAPFIAIQGVYAAQDETREKGFVWAQRAVERDPNDAFALISLSALHGQRGDFKAIIDLLAPHEAKMSRDVRLAHNYFEALFRSREMEKVTRLLNALAGSTNRQVKQFAVERTRVVAQYFQQQQQQLSNVAASARVAPSGAPAPAQRR